MDTDAISIVRDIFDHIDTNIPRDITPQSDYARRLFEHLALEGGRVTALGDPTYQKTRIDELGTWTGDPWETPTYGLDASTTRPLEFNNGLIVDTAYAKLGVAGAAANITGCQRRIIAFDPRGTYFRAVAPGQSLEDAPWGYPTEDGLERVVKAGEVIRLGPVGSEDGSVEWFS